MHDDATERRPTPELRTLMDGLVFGEQPRWHQGRLWFSDWGTQEVIAGSGHSAQRTGAPFNDRVRQFIDGA